MILVNGETGSAISALDRGLAYGDGVFRTLTAHGGPLHWRRHYTKLARDCARLAIECPMESVLEGDVKRVCEGIPNAIVKVIVTRGGGERGYRYGGLEPTRVVIATRRHEERGTDDEGIRTRLCRLRIAHQPALAGVKHLNRLENVLARAEWQDPQIAEGVLADSDMNVIGGTMSNLFVVNAGKLATPDLSRCGVAGVTRDRVIDAAAQHGLACEVRDIAVSELAQADELFVVNSVIGVRPVRRFEDRDFAPGPLTKTVRHWLAHDADA